MTVYQDDTNERGHWVKRGLVKVWVPDDATATRDRYRELVAERYAEPTWFATPPPEPEDQMTCRRRLAECVAEDGWGEQRPEREAG